MTGKIALQEIENKKEIVFELAKNIWENPEIAFQEVKASAWSAELLEKEGFEVERNYVGMPTAIKATWGSGKPVIGFLGEYDALPNMSQTVSTEKEAVVEDGPGHGCGHNLMITACIAAAIGMKKEMTERNLSGTIIVYGCPAEEVLTGKGFMARGGAFRELDMAFSWHPISLNEGSMVKGAGLNSAKFHFKGTTAHAGGDPFNGRSALDAAELMNVGANFLREHVPDITRIHYAFTDVHGAPNVVPDKASVWYFVRALSRESVVETYDRLIKVAKGAAMMTETEVEVEFLGGCYETMQNRTLLDTIRETMLELPSQEWTEEEIKFAEALNKISANYEKMSNAGIIEKNTHLANTVNPLTSYSAFGSNDISEVQHIVPTTVFMTACCNLGAAYHSWQITACAGHSIGMKGMIYGANTMAVSGLKIIEDPEILIRAKDEFDKEMNGRTYVCPIPDEIPIPLS